jgi:hypothetical protein
VGLGSSNPRCNPSVVKLGPLHPHIPSLPCHPVPYYLCKSDSLRDGVCLVQNDFVFMAIQDVLPQHPREVVIHIGVDVVELADEGVFDPVSNRLDG